jgi:hypothetical protein
MLNVSCITKHPDLHFRLAQDGLASFGWFFLSLHQVGNMATLLILLKGHQSLAPWAPLALVPPLAHLTCECFLFHRPDHQCSASSINFSNARELRTCVSCLQQCFLSRSLYYRKQFEIFVSAHQNCIRTKACVTPLGDQFKNMLIS